MFWAFINVYNIQKPFHGSGQIAQEYDNYQYKVVYRSVRSRNKSECHTFTWSYMSIYLCLISSLVFKPSLNFKVKNNVFLFFPTSPKSLVRIHRTKNILRLAANKSECHTFTWSYMSIYLCLISSMVFKPSLNFKVKNNVFLFFPTSPKSSVGIHRTKNILRLAAQEVYLKTKTKG